MSLPLKILLVQLYSNGDCLYATTVARQIKNDFPNCKLTWGIASYCKSIIANNNYVDEIMEVNTIAKNDIVAFRKFKKQLNQFKEQGIFDEIFITHNMDTNLALYDGSIRSGIFRAYPNPITVPVQPVLNLYDDEIKNAATFAEKHQLQNYDHVILFEYAPQSRQIKISDNFSISIAEKLTSNPDTAVILSSGNKITHPNKNIIDGSVLTLRETAALTHYCSILLGCTSGITWISTSNAAKQLPMIQLINPDAIWLNSVSNDFKKFGLDDSGVIEITDMVENIIVRCINEAMINFTDARKKYNKQIPLHFRATRDIVYNLLCYLEFKAIAKHIKINREVYGNDLSFYKEIFLGFITAPFKLIKNIFLKKILKRYEY